MSNFKIYGVVNEANTYYCQEIAQKIADYSTQSISIEFHAILQVDYLIKLEEIKKTLNVSLIHYNKNHIVLRNNQFIGDVYAFQEFSRSEFEIEPDGMNQIICNRNVREGTFQIMTNRGRPVVFLEFVDKAAPHNETSPEFGRIYIEL